MNWLTDPWVHGVATGTLGVLGTWAAWKYLDHIWGGFISSIRVPTDQELDQAAPLIADQHPSLEAHRLHLTNGLLGMLCGVAFTFGVFQLFGYFARLIGVAVAGDVMTMFAYLFVVLGMLLATRLIDQHAVHHRALRWHFATSAQKSRKR